jgi:hypothetical protein
MISAPPRIVTSRAWQGITPPFTTLLLPLPVLITVTFSTARGHYTQNPLAGVNECNGDVLPTVRQNRTHQEISGGAEEEFPNL